MVYHKGQFLVLYYFFYILMTSDFARLNWTSISLLMIQIYFYAGKSLTQIESVINAELAHVETWLSANKLSLNIIKSNFVIFHPSQKKKRISIFACQ